MNGNTESITALIQNASALIETKLPTPEALTMDLPLQVALIGQPQQNLFGILTGLGVCIGDLDRPLYRSFRCTLSYGEEKVAVSQDGEMVETTAAELAQTLSQYHSATAPLLCSIQVPQEALKNISLQIIASSRDYADVEWEQVLMAFDYCYFTLTVTALLSMTERKILRSHLLPAMNQQLGILTTNDHLILSADRADIDDSLSSFFKGQVPIFSTEQEDFSLIGEIEKLSVDVDSLRQSRSDRSAQICLQKVVHQLDLQIQVLSENSEALDDALAILEDKARTLPSHMKAASRRARMQYTSPMKLDITAQTSHFYQALKEQLQKDIAKRNDISDLQDVLPGYITSQWEKKIAQLQNDLEYRVEKMQESLQTYIENDIRSYIESGVDMATADYIFCLTNMYGSKVVLSKSDTLKFEEKTSLLKSMLRSGESTLMAVTVGLLVMSHPLLGAGAAFFSLKDQKKKLLAENRQGLLDAADKMSKDIFDQVVIQLDRTVTTLEDNLNTAVEACYQKIMDTMVQALTNRKHDQNSYADKLEQLNAIKSEMAALLR